MRARSGQQFWRMLPVVLAVAFAPVEDGCLAGRQYNDAVPAITRALRSYENCVAQSLGRNDCSGEFGELELEQDRFENAVADLRKGCR